MQTEHLFELTYILLEKKNVTASNMADHFGVSTRTIYRWIDALNLAGVPVFCTKGKGGGIRIAENYALDKTVFTENEKLEILSSVQAFNTLIANKNFDISDSTSSNSLNKSDKSLLTKLKNFTQNYTDWIQIDFAPWNKKMVQMRDVFNILKNAILTEMQIQFDYYSTKGLSQNRIVEPWQIIFRSQAWYLFGFCKSKNQVRFFKLSRITSIKILNCKNIQPKQNYSNYTEVQNGYNNAQFIENKIRLKLQIKNNEIYRILDEYDVEQIESSEFEQKNKGVQNACSVVTIQLPNFPWLTSWILSFGSDVKVLEPKKLRDEIDRIVKEMLRD